MTKSIVAATALALVGKCKLVLNDLIRDYLPYFQSKGADGEMADITIHHLLTHTAGLIYDAGPQTTPAERMFNSCLSDTNLDFDASFHRLAIFPLLGAPGTT